MEYQYSVSEWMLFFYVYCLIGWCIESAFVSLRKRKFVNRGFMRGTFLPLYGSGAVLLMFVTIPFRDHIIAIFFVGALAASALEYVTGAAMEAMFQVRYWDYSQNKFNVNGHICLSTSIAWGVLTVILVRWIHAPIERWIAAIPDSLKSILAAAVTIGAAADFALSFKAALDLKHILGKMEKAKQNLQQAQSRLDAIIAFAHLKENGKKTSRIGKISDLLQDIKKKLELLQRDEQQAEGKERKWLPQFKAELEQLKETYIVEREKNRSVRDWLGFYRRSMLKSHPTLSSPKFREALAELKAASEEKREKKKKKDGERHEEKDKL